MAETGEETYYIVGESRTNVDNAITKVYGSFFEYYGYFYTTCPD